MLSSVNKCYTLYSIHINKLQTLNSTPMPFDSSPINKKSPRPKTRTISGSIAFTG